jgi:hypothetical protein
MRFSETVARYARLLLYIPIQSKSQSECCPNVNEKIETNRGRDFLTPCLDGFFKSCCVSARALLSARCDWPPSQVHQAGDIHSGFFFMFK